MTRPGNGRRHPDGTNLLGSLIVTSNMVFSQWEEIFQSPMTTAAAIDRIVYDSVIAECSMCRATV